MRVNCTSTISLRPCSRTTTGILSWTPPSCSSSSSKTTRWWSCSPTPTRRATSCSGQRVRLFAWGGQDGGAIATLCILPLQLFWTFSPRRNACTHISISAHRCAILSYAEKSLNSIQPVQTLLKASCGILHWQKNKIELFTSYNFFCLLISSEMFCSCFPVY